MKTLHETRNFQPGTLNPEPGIRLCVLFPVTRFAKLNLPKIWYYISILLIFQPKYTSALISDHSLKPFILIKTGRIFHSIFFYNLSNPLITLNLKLMKRLTFLIALLVLSSISLLAQVREISGRITDADNGEPLPGVAVTIKGTTVGTITNVDGVYTLSVPADAQTLVFTYVGMKTSEENIGGRMAIDLAMVPDVFGLGDIIVTGYATQTRASLTGSVSTVEEKKMNISPAPSALSRIQGQVSGVNISYANVPGGEATVRVRGLGTINDNNPLYVIDGVPVGPDNNLNPNDIESITVLKDASSAAIYGTRGANGVIIITTKHGRAGEKANVNLSVRTGITKAVNQYNLLNTAEYGEMLWIQARAQGLEPGLHPVGHPLYYSHPQYGAGIDPVTPDYILPAGTMEANIDRSLYKYPDYTIFQASKPGTNWYDEIYRNAKYNEVDLSVSGGSENATYAFSGNYLNEEGVLRWTDFKRFTFRANTDARFTKWLKAGESIQISYTDAGGDLSDNGEGTVISQAYRCQPIIPVYDIMGKFAGSKAPAMGNAANPVAMLYRARNNFSRNYRVLGNVFAEINILQGLSFKSLLGYNVNNWNGKYYSFATWESSEPSRIDGLSVQNSNDFQWNWYNTLSYVTTIANSHHLNVILGTEAINNKSTWMGAGRSQYFSTSTDFMQLDVGEINQTNYGNGEEDALFSIFGRLNYDYQGKYLLDFTLRRDGSSRFGEKERYATFPAFSVAWALTEEDFMTGTRGWLDFLKLRFGWGKSGNDRIRNYNMYSTYGTNIMHSAYDINGTKTSSVQGFQPNSIGNPDVTWEATTTLDGGVDAIFLNNTLNFKFDLWQRYTTDMLYRLQIPQVNGTAAAPFVNIGEMKNTGFDIELGYNNTALSGKIRYGITASISHYKNEIMKLSKDVKEEIIPGALRQVVYTRATVGTAFPEFYGYIMDGIIQDDTEAAAAPKYGAYTKPGHFKFRDLNGDGVITPDDMTYIGSPHPDLTGGLNIDLGYGDIDVNMFFYGSLGNDMINYVNRWIDLGQFNGGISRRALEESWGSPYLNNNSDATLPLFDLADGSQQPSTHFIEDASFLRMKSLRIGYTLPKKLSNKLTLSNLRVYVMATNLFTITKYSGLNPEFNSSGDQMGLDQGAWPTPRQVIVGLTLGL
jgi:TonB-linked SusC/RagA family outer membrane protein